MTSVNFLYSSPPGAIESASLWAWFFKTLSLAAATASFYLEAPFNWLPALLWAIVLSFCFSPPWAWWSECSCLDSWAVCGRVASPSCDCLLFSPLSRNSSPFFAASSACVRKAPPWLLSSYRSLLFRLLSSSAFWSRAICSRRLLATSCALRTSIMWTRFYSPRALVWARQWISWSFRLVYFS